MSTWRKCLFTTLLTALHTRVFFALGINAIQFLSKIGGNLAINRN